MEAATVVVALAVVVITAEDGAADVVAEERRCRLSVPRSMATKSH